ncbi:phosphatase PAP2 family protein [Agaricicola taiwanensis]|uniref:Phosphatase PAP2 family protein n=1 Tax=Agaricicola taiwanensis TaxID=591372 RepID=A0A8J2YEM8_9RHOB|nr:phosphatase PAP2 family protein [Agaricicola taiwanensis]GGE37843.1 phosphatase PAP2 family protein [Agaricicola taiwanensis]
MALGFRLPFRFSLEQIVTLARRELILIATLLLIAGGFWTFLSIADEVREGETSAFDQWVLLALRDPTNHTDPRGPVWMQEMARDITALGGIPVLTMVTLVVIGYLLMSRKRGASLLVAVSVFGGMALSSLLKIGFDRPRPDLVPHEVHVYTLSFPSGHAMLAAVTYLTLGVLLTRVSPRTRLRAYILAIAVLLTVMIGCSRLYLGVHWPTDVLAGWSIGAAWALACWVVALWLQRRGAVEQADQTTPEPTPS